MFDYKCKLEFFFFEKYICINKNEKIKATFCTFQTFKKFQNSIPN